MTTIDQDLLRSWKLHMQAKGNSKRTIIAYTHAFNRLHDWLEANERSLDVSTLDRHAMQAHQLDINERYAPATAKLHYLSLNQLFKFLVDEDELATNPLARVHMPKVPESPIPIFEPEAIKAMLAVWSGKTFTDRRNTAMLMMLADSGARRFEIADLDVDGVDIIAGTALVRGKGGNNTGPKYRVVTFGTQTAVALDRYLRARQSHPWASRSDALWLGQRGRMGVDGLATVVSKTCERVGVKGGHTHLFRHTWASAMKEAGMQPDEMKALAGWATDAMLQKYGRATLDRRAVVTGRRHSTMDRLARR